MARRTFFLLCLFALFLIPGCARSPQMSGGTSGTGTQLIVTMTVRGRINPNFFYFVLFNNANDANGAAGPIPVLSAPWGNGFAAGAFTHFMRYDATQPSSGYSIYAVIPSSQLRSFTYLGSPVQFVPVNGGNTLQFQIPLSQLATTAVPAGQINVLQVNFLATNRIPVDPNDPGTKYYDALGDGRQIGGINNVVTLRTTQAQIYQNSNSINPEPSGDVMETGSGVSNNINEPDLDIIDWKVEVRN